MTYRRVAGAAKWFYVCEWRTVDPRAFRIPPLLPRFTLARVAARQAPGSRSRTTHTAVLNMTTTRDVRDDT